MSEIIHKQRNVSVLMYHIVCPAKYRRSVITGEVEKKLKEVCLGIEARYEIKFLEIGSEKDHVHFLIQSVPTYSPTKIVTTIKSLTAMKILESNPEVKIMGRKFLDSRILCRNRRGVWDGESNKGVHKESGAEDRKV